MRCAWGAPGAAAGPPKPAHRPTAPPCRRRLPSRCFAACTQPAASALPPSIGAGRAFHGGAPGGSQRRRGASSDGRSSSLGAASRPPTAGGARCADVHRCGQGEAAFEDLGGSSLPVQLVCYLGNAAAQPLCLKPSTQASSHTRPARLQSRQRRRPRRWAAALGSPPRRFPVWAPQLTRPCWAAALRGPRRRSRAALRPAARWAAWRVRRLRTPPSEQAAWCLRCRQLALHAAHSSCWSE